MRITITGKNIEVSEYLSDLVTKKVSKLDKYFPEDTEAHVTLAVERNRHIVEVTIPYAGGIIRGEAPCGRRTDGKRAFPPEAGDSKRKVCC